VVKSKRPSGMLHAGWPSVVHEIKHLPTLR